MIGIPFCLHLVVAANADFEPLMTLYLTNNTTPEIIREAKASGILPKDIVGISYGAIQVFLLTTQVVGNAKNHSLI